MASFFEFPFPFQFRKMTKSKKKNGARTFKKRAFPVRRRPMKSSKPTTFKKRTSKRKRKGTTVKTLAKRVTKLSKSVETGLADLTHRKLSLGTFSTAVGKQLTASVTINNQGAVNDSLSAVPYFDSSTNTIVTIDASDNASTYQRSYLFKYQSVRVKLTNNYTTPCTVDARLVVPTHDTSVTPISAYLAGLIDVGSPDPDGLLTLLSDSQVYNDMWKSQVGKKATIQPGETLVLFAPLGAMNFEIQTAEADSLQFRKDEKPMALMIRLQGPVGHDSVDSTQLSYLKASLQYEIEVIRKIEYQAGLSIKRFIAVEDNIQTAFTNQGQVAQKPVGGLQGFETGVF